MRYFLLTKKSMTWVVGLTWEEEGAVVKYLKKSSVEKNQWKNLTDSIAGLKAEYMNRKFLLDIYHHVTQHQRLKS